MTAPTTAPHYRGTHRRPGSSLGHLGRLGRVAVALTALSVLATLFLDVFLVTASVSMMLVGPVALVRQLWRVRGGADDAVTTG
ncbi:hypothetical protein [Micromonospora sp. DT47]|uniref:hypothetical protein n=1 Tax=Micromonospora sp. DT47 TaxID=3393431 RepID=UPI003CF74923